MGSFAGIPLMPGRYGSGMTVAGIRRRTALRARHKAWQSTVRSHVRFGRAGRGSGAENLGRVFGADRAGPGDRLASSRKVIAFLQPCTAWIENTNGTWR